MPEPLLIGIDGGGTKCRARLSDLSGATLGEGGGGPSNVRLAPSLVMGSIMDASREAAAAAGLSEADLERAHAGFGLAGAALTSACDALRAEPNPFASIAIETDTHAAWLGAFQGEDGAIFIMGTGSSALAVVGGEAFEVAGYGAEVSDEASGQWIGRQAIRRALWVHDGRLATTPLAEAVLERFDNSAEKIIAFATDALPADYATLSPLVFEHAAADDPLARAIITEAAADAGRVIDRLIAVGAPAVALIGGVAQPLSAWFSPEHRARIAKPRGDALDGALLMARRAMAAAE